MAVSNYASYMKRAFIYYGARPLQKGFHDNAKRSAVAVCQRRFGQPVLAVNQLLWRILSSGLNRPQGAYIALTLY